MKKLLFFSLILVFLSSCSDYQTGELSGSSDRPMWQAEVPFGMLYMPLGSLNVGPSDQDVPWAMTARNRSVSLQAFWMDETEITNNEYRQFVDWVRDSLAYVKLFEEGGLEQFYVMIDKYGEDIPEEDQYIDWSQPIDWTDMENREYLSSMFLQGDERFYKKKELDVRQLNYVFYWMDLKQAAVKNKIDGKERRAYNYETGKYDGEVLTYENSREPISDRSSYIIKEEVNVYPDTLCWISDFTYSYNDPMASMYFWHPAYDHYPLVGVSWKQAVAFNVWRTQLKNGFLRSMNRVVVNDYRLPTELEWEYASRGGLSSSPYPWGGNYTRNYLGCFIANFKPLRGNYTDDGGMHTVIVAHYEPNEWGLYDMAGNVAEWTKTAFEESSYGFTHDANTENYYRALDDDPIVQKRKTVRGGSWKDVAYYLQNGTRTYEYQDSAKSFIGFRSVRTYLGRSFTTDGVQGDSQVY
ncbi:MAG: SUMF1/EgtB/PvdO family nonheme iron enzyme [Bacteroidota bacterium]